MKLSTILLTCVLLLAASNSDSCGKEAPNARENPYGDTPNCVKADSLGCRQLAPAPTPKYSASQPAAEYEAAKERTKSGADE